jgi:uncharacterized membrane protein YoaK (UPF0700 family)
VLLALTALTGIVDAVSYLALGHVFTANMTGNIVLVGFELIGTPGLSAAGGGLALLAFVVGAVLGGRLVRGTIGGQTYRWVSAALVAEGGLLCAAAAVVSGSAQDLSNQAEIYTAIVLLGAAMGIRAAAVRRLAIPDLVTIVLTQTTAALAAESFLAGGRNARWEWRVGSIAAMIAGAAFGAWLLKYSRVWPLALCGAVSGGCALAVYLRKEGTDRDGAPDSRTRAPTAREDPLVSSRMSGPFHT